MTRLTLKLPKPLDPAAPRVLTSRARRAQRKAVAKPAGVATAPAGAAAPVAAKATAKPDAKPGAKRAARPAAKPSPPSRQRKPATPRASGDAPTVPRVARDDSKPRDPPRDKPRTKLAPAVRAPEQDVPAVPVRVGPAPGRPDLPRLSKRMSELGLCSRREADEWIENGWVRVNGEVVTTLGTRVHPQARIEVDRAASQHQSELATILLHKPVGYVSGQAEDGHEPAIALITPQNHWTGDTSRTPFKPSQLRGLAPAGRLDIDSTGLIVFTQDGRIAKHLIGRDSEVEKEYLVRVEGKLSAENMRLLQHGLMLDGVKLKPARVSWQNEDQLRFALREGRQRQIRRMCEAVGLVVTGLKRVRIGSVPLGALPPGQWRYLRRDEKF